MILILEYLFYYVLSTAITVFINRKLPQKYALGWLKFLLQFNFQPKIYDKYFRVKKWKHNLPQLSHIDKSVHDKSKISYNYEDLLDYRDALEKGIFAHIFPPFALMIILVVSDKPLEAIVFNTLVWWAFHFPFALSQLYNHVRIDRLIKSKERNQKR